MQLSPEFREARPPEPVSILLLEDDDAFADLVRRSLARAAPAGLVLERAPTLGAALERLRGGAFDLVLSDMNVPDSSGLATLRSLAESTQAPIVAMTGEVAEGLRERAMAHGACELLGKDRIDRLELERVARLARLHARGRRAREAGEALLESEARFRALVELSADWYWEQDEHLRFVHMAGRIDPEARSARLGRTCWEMEGDEPVSGSWDEHRALLARREPYADFLLRCRRRDGSVRYVSVSAQPVFDDAGVFRGYRGATRDATRVVQARREEALLALEHSVVRDLAEAGSAREALPAVMGAICRLEGWQCCRYFELDKASGTMRLRASWSDRSPAILRFIEGSAALAYGRNDGLVGLSWRTGEPLWVEDAADDPRVAMTGLAKSAGLHGALIVPVTFEGSAMGVLSISNTSVMPPDDRLMRALRVIGAQIGQFLRRKRAEADLRESELRFRKLTELSSDFYWKTDGTHRLVELMYGSRHRPVLQQTLGKARWELPSTYPAAEGWAAHRADFEARRPFRDFEFARIDDEGVERHMSITGEPLFGEAGAFEGYRGVGRDITAHKHDQRIMALEHEITRALAEAESERAGVDAVLRALCAQQGWALGRYWRAGEAAEMLRLGGAWPAASGSAPQEADEEKVLHPGEGHAGSVWQSGAPLWRDGELAFPVSVDGKAIGVLALSGGAPRPPDARLLQAVGVIGPQLGQFLQRKQADAALAFLAQFDALTGLPNRALLHDRFSQMIVQATRRGSPLGVLFIDLDDFKLVNDTLGHAGGDELLRHVAQRLQATVRPGDTVARISGDEFAVILGDLARPEDAALVAQKIIDRLAAPMVLRGKEVFVTSSIGIAAHPADGGDADSLLAAADAAMYRAKQSGRNGYQFFTADINQRMRARAQLGSELRRALERGEFGIAYQPKVDLRSGKPCAAEALLRWRHPERGTVYPGEFIPVLEETGMIVQVGEWVVRRACEDLIAWKAAGLEPLPVAVNLSVRQFREPDLDTRLIELVRGAGVAPSLIELEITESQLMQDPEHAIRMVRSLREAGIRMAIDDFGTGYSSLTYLSRFPVSALKVDRSFVANVLSDPADATIVRTIIDMAHTLGFTVIAEGVEREEQASFLRALGCEQGQGYLFARPMREPAFRALLAPGR